MAAYPGMMPHMVAAPEDDVVPHLDKGLDGVVLKDKCVFPNVVQGNKARGMRTNIFGQAVPLFLGLVKLCLPETSRILPEDISVLPFQSHTPEGRRNGLAS